MAGREGERKANKKHNIEKIHPFEFEHPLLSNQRHDTPLEKDKDGNECVCVHVQVWILQVRNQMFDQ